MHNPADASHNRSQVKRQGKKATSPEKRQERNPSPENKRRRTSQVREGSYNWPKERKSNQWSPVERFSGREWSPEERGRRRSREWTPQSPPHHFHPAEDYSPAKEWKTRPASPTWQPPAEVSRNRTRSRSSPKIAGRSKSTKGNVRSETYPTKSRPSKPKTPMVTEKDSRTLRELEEGKRMEEKFKMITSNLTRKPKFHVNSESTSPSDTDAEDDDDDEDDDEEEEDESEVDSHEDVAKEKRLKDETGKMEEKKHLEIQDEIIKRIHNKIEDPVCDNNVSDYLDASDIVTKDASDNNDGKTLLEKVNEIIKSCVKLKEDKTISEDKLKKANKIIEKAQEKKRKLTLQAEDSKQEIIEKTPKEKEERQPSPTPYTGQGGWVGIKDLSDTVTDQKRTAPKNIEVQKEVGEKEDNDKIEAESDGRRTPLAYRQDRARSESMSEFELEVSLDSKIREHLEEDGELKVIVKPLPQVKKPEFSLEEGEVRSEADDTGKELDESILNNNPKKTQSDLEEELKKLNTELHEKQGTIGKLETAKENKSGAKDTKARDTLRTRRHSYSSSRSRSRSKSRSRTRSRSRSRSRSRARSWTRSRSRSRPRSRHYSREWEDRRPFHHSRGRGDRGHYRGGQHGGYRGGDRGDRGGDRAGDRGGDRGEDRGHYRDYEYRERSPPAERQQGQHWIPVTPCALEEDSDLPPGETGTAYIRAKGEFSFRDNSGCMVRITKWTGKDSMSRVQIRPQIVELGRESTIKIEVGNPQQDRTLELMKHDKIACLSVLSAPTYPGLFSNIDCSPERYETQGKRWFKVTTVVLHKKGINCLPTNTNKKYCISLVTLFHWYHILITLYPGG